MKFVRSFLVLLMGGLLLLQAGCGYTRKMTLPRDVKTIYIDTFQNRMVLGEIYAYEPGMEIKITNAVIRRLQTDGNLKVTAREKADAVLEGELTAIQQDGVRFTGLERVEEYRLYLIVNLKLRDQKTGEVLWVGSETQSGYSMEDAADTASSDILHAVRKTWPKSEGAK